MSEGRDLYRILQVDPEADLDIIQTVYRRLAQKFHPDRNAGSEGAAARMIELNAAWEVLRDPLKREAYDRERAHRTDGAGRGAARRPGAGSVDQAGPAGAARPAAAGPAAAGTAGARPDGHGPAGSGGTRPGPRATGWRATPSGTAGVGGGRAGEPASGDWSSGRSAYGGGYDPSMRAPDGLGAAGAPPGNPEGSVLGFGRYVGWSLGEVARVDLEFLEWLERSPAGRQYREELDALLRRHGRRRAPGDDADRRGLYRR